MELERNVFCTNGRGRQQVDSGLVAVFTSYLSRDGTVGECWTTGSEGKDCERGRMLQTRWEEIVKSHRWLRELVWFGETVCGGEVVVQVMFID